MSGADFRTCDREEFLGEFFPDPGDRAEQRAYRLAEMRRRLGFSQAQVAAPMGVTQGRVSAIENAGPNAESGRLPWLPRGAFPARTRSSSVRVSTQAGSVDRGAHAGARPRAPSLPASAPDHQCTGSSVHDIAGSAQTSGDTISRPAPVVACPRKPWPERAR